MAYFQMQCTVFVPEILQSGPVNKMSRRQELEGGRTKTTATGLLADVLKLFLQAGVSPKRA